MDAFDANAQDVGLSLDTIEEEIEQGLVLHADRLVDAFDNEEYYAARNLAYIRRRQSEDWVDFVKRPKRTSHVTRKVVRVLGDCMYNPGPTRRLKDAAADKFLADVYEQNHVNAVLNQADRKAILNGVAGIQAHATGRPEKPIRLYLWGAHEMVVWTWPDDPTEAWAVCTITRQRRQEGQRFEQRLQYEVWSRDEHRIYQTKWAPVPYEANYCEEQYRSCFGRAAAYIPFMSGEPAGSGKNPYGVLPFSFVHDEFPVSDFYEGGIGNALRKMNAEVDRELSDLAEHAKDCMNPDRFLIDVSTAWRREKRTGQWQELTGRKGGEDGVKPQALIVQPALVTEQVWYGIQSYVNNTLEDLDVPLVAVRDDVNQHLSGIAIQAKYQPLIDRAQGRQPLFGVAENDLARLVLMVAGSAYGESRLQALAEDPQLELIWPVPRAPATDATADAHDQFELNEGASSLLDYVAKQYGLTHDQAKGRIERVIEDNKWLTSVMPPPPPPPEAPPEQQSQALEQTLTNDVKAEVAGSIGSH